MLAFTTLSGFNCFIGNILEMETQEKIDLLRIINEQVSSSILGGEEADNTALENEGYIKIDRSSVQWWAVITPLGRAFLEENW